MTAANAMRPDFTGVPMPEVRPYKSQPEANGFFDVVDTVDLATADLMSAARWSRGIVLDGPDGAPRLFACIAIDGGKEIAMLPASGVLCRRVPWSGCDIAEDMLFFLPEIPSIWAACDTSLPQEQFVLRGNDRWVSINLGAAEPFTKPNTVLVEPGEVKSALPEVKPGGELHHLTSTEDSDA